MRNFRKVLQFEVFEVLSMYLLKNVEKMAMARFLQLLNNRPQDRFEQRRDRCAVLCAEAMCKAC